MIVSAFAAMLATAGCDSSPPVASYGPDLSGIETMALRGDPYARAALTPAQRQRVNAYQASHPASAPTWGRDAVNMGAAAGGGYLLGQTASSARATATATTEASAVDGAATAGEAAIGDGVAAAGERAVLGEGAAAVTEGVGLGEGAAAVTEGIELGEILEGACLLLCW